MCLDINQAPYSSSNIDYEGVNPWKQVTCKVYQNAPLQILCKALRNSWNVGEQGFAFFALAASLDRFAESLAAQALHAASCTSARGVEVFRQTWQDSY
jgi:hypothetical protein